MYVSDENTPREQATILLRKSTPGWKSFVLKTSRLGFVVKKNAVVCASEQDGQARKDGKDGKDVFERGDTHSCGPTWYDLNAYGRNGSFLCTRPRATIFKFFFVILDLRMHAGATAKTAEGAEELYDDWVGTYDASLKRFHLCVITT